MMRYTLTEKINDTKKRIIACVAGVVFTVCVIVIGVAAPLIFKGNTVGENISSTLINDTTDRNNTEITSLSEKRANDKIEAYLKQYGVK